MWPPLTPQWVASYCWMVVKVLSLLQAGAPCYCWMGVEIKLFTDTWWQWGSGAHHLPEEIKILGSLTSLVRVGV